MIRCHRCGEELTAPYFHEGRPYGYSCIKIVNPSTKRKKEKQHWVRAESNNLDISINKQFVISVFNGRKYKALVLINSSNKHVSLDGYCKIGAEGETYINLAAFKSYPFNTLTNA